MLKKRKRDEIEELKDQIEKLTSSEKELKHLRDADFQIKCEEF